MTDMKLSYGVFLEKETVYELLPQLLAKMSLLEKKAIYAGFSYDPTHPAVEAVDSDNPEFMVTDFGEMELMDVLVAYVRNNYSYLYCSPFQDEERAAVTLNNTLQWIQEYGEFSPENFNNIPAEEKAEMDKFIADLGLSLKPQPIIWSQYY